MSHPFFTPPPLVVIAHGYSHHIWGSERVALDCAQAYRNGGWQVQFYLPGPGPFAELVAQNGFEIVLQRTCEPEGSRLTRLARLPIEVGVQLSRSNPDLIHTTSLGPVRALAANARLQGIPIITQLQTRYAKAELKRHCITWSDLVIPVSEYAAQPARELIQDLGEDASTRIETVIPPVNRPDDYPRSRAAELRRLWNIKPGEVTVGIAGQVIHRKGVDLFIKACAGLRKSGLPIRPVMIGDVPAGHENYGREVDMMITRLGLGKSLIRTGFVQDMDAHFSALDILAVPSRDEGLGLVAGEAMRCGTTVVAANTGGLPELVVPRKTGLLFTADSAGDLEKTLFGLLVDPEYRVDLTDRARHHANENFSRRIFEEKLLTLSQSVTPQPLRGIA